MDIDDLNYDRCCLRKERDEARNELRATKRALWMARALRADEKADFIEKASTENHTRFFYEPVIDCWRTIALKCYGKAEEYR